MTDRLPKKKKLEKSWMQIARETRCHLKEEYPLVNYSVGYHWTLSAKPKVNQQHSHEIEEYLTQLYPHSKLPTKSSIQWRKTICSTHTILHRGCRFDKHLQTISYFSQDQARNENGKLEVSKEYWRPQAPSSAAPDKKPLHSCKWS